MHVHTMTWALAVPGIPSPNLGLTRVSGSQAGEQELVGPGSNTKCSQLTTTLGDSHQTGKKFPFYRSVRSASCGSNRTQATGSPGMGDKHEPPGASGAAGHVHGHDATIVSQGSTDTEVTPPTPHLDPNV